MRIFNPLSYYSLFLVRRIFTYINDGGLHSVKFASVLFCIVIIFYLLLVYTPSHFPYYSVLLRTYSFFLHTVTGLFLPSSASLDDDDLKMRTRRAPCSRVSIAALAQW